MRFGASGLLALQCSKRIAVAIGFSWRPGQGSNLYQLFNLGAVAFSWVEAPQLNIITMFLAGYLLPGQPIANACFNVYSNVSLSHAAFFLVDFKLGHYMKIPPRAMFMSQVIGTLVAAVWQLGVAWWLLMSIPNICNTSLLPSSSPWTCPGDTVFFDSSVVWGLVGPQRIFGSKGKYSSLNWFFLIGFLSPIPIWGASKVLPRKSWLTLVNFPIIFTAAANIPPASSVNYTTWILVGTIFNFYVLRYRNNWWRRYNYVLSAALDGGTAFLGVFLYFCLDLNGFRQLSWWGSIGGDHCPLASCPTEAVKFPPGCPVL